MWGMDREGHTGALTEARNQRVEALVELLP
jgi:hypothetical protein